jgi:hypothetical protein
VGPARQGRRREGEAGGGKEREKVVGAFVRAI